MSTRTTRRAQSQAPLTHQESLLLAQAVWEVGASPTSWVSVSKLLSKHPLLSRPKAFFSAQACHSMYEQLMKDAELEINDTCHAAHAPINRKLAEKHYQLRHSELRNLIVAEETKFRTVLKEIDAIRAGSAEQKVDENTVAQSSTKETIQAKRDPSNAAQDIADDSDLSGVTELLQDRNDEVETETDRQTPHPDATQIGTNVQESTHPSDAAETPVQTEQQMDEDDNSEQGRDADMQGPPPAEPNSAGNLTAQDAAQHETAAPSSGKNDSGGEDVDDSERASQLREEEEEEEEAVLKQAEEEESKGEDEEEGSQGHQEEDVQMGNERNDDQATAEASSSEEEAPVVATRRSSRRRKSSAASLQPPPSRKRLRSQGRMSVERQEDQDSEDEQEDVERKESESPQPEDEQNSSPFEGSTTRRGKRKASYQDGSPSDKKRLREDSEPMEEDESGPSTNTRGGRTTRHGARTDDKAALKRFQNVIGMLHSQISQHRNGNIFHNPIKHSEAPDYHEIVKRPMDLKTIKTRVKDGVIGNSLEFQRDIFLMFANALVYNRPGSDVHAMAEDMMLESEGQINAFRQTEGLVKRGQRP